MADSGTRVVTWQDIRLTGLPRGHGRVVFGDVALFDVSNGDALRDIAVRLATIADEWQGLAPGEAQTQYQELSA